MGKPINSIGVFVAQKNNVVFAMSSHPTTNIRVLGIKAVRTPSLLYRIATSRGNSSVILQTVQDAAVGPFPFHH